MAVVGGSSATTTLPSLRNPPSSAAFRRSSPPPPPQVSIFSKSSFSRTRVSARSPSLNLNLRCKVVSHNSVQKDGIGFKASTSSPLELLKSSAVDNLLTWSETPPTHSQPPGSAPRSHQISPIQSLVGQTSRRWVVGVISQLEDGHFYLEDLTASVEINLSNVKITTRFFSENTIVVAEGEMLVEGIFQIRLAEMEKIAINDMFAILSDIWLDNEEAVMKLFGQLSEQMKDSSHI